MTSDRSSNVKTPDNRVRAPRFALHRDLIVESKTIGTNMTYKLTTENISRSGLLLTWPHDMQVPFIVNTILELRIDPRGALLDMPVSCLGKVVRRADPRTVPGLTATEFGIQIIQIDNTDLGIWENCLEAISKAMREAFPEETAEVAEPLISLAGNSH